MRAELPVLRARQLRMRAAGALQQRDPLTPGDALRVARLVLDAGGRIPPALVLDAGRAANLAGDPALGAQLAEIARADGAGLEATLLLARAHTVRQRFADAEAVLAADEDRAPGDPVAIVYVEQRMFVPLLGAPAAGRRAGAARPRDDLVGGPGLAAAAGPAEGRARRPDRQLRGHGRGDRAGSSPRRTSTPRSGAA